MLPGSEPVRVLLVEDSAADAAVVRFTLEHAGPPPFLLDHVSSLAQAVDRIGRSTADVVLLDLTLAGEEHVAVLDEMIRAAPATPVVVLTGHNDEATALMALQKGAQDYLVKGSTPAALLTRTLRYAIERQRVHLQLSTLAAQLRDANARLERLVVQDPLTELIDRRGLQRALSREVEVLKRRESELFALLVDLDDFHRLNESLGHGFGDVVLKEVAGRLLARLRPTDGVGRIGGDEFLVLLPGTRPVEALRIAERLRLCISGQRIALTDRSVHVTTSIAVVRVTETMPSVDEVLIEARRALQNSKRAGKNRVSAGDGIRDDKAIPQVLAALREGRGLRAVKHPIVSLADDGVRGWELLSRLDVGVLHNPVDFFRIAMEADILTPVDHQCLRTCAAASRGLPAGSMIHVNLFPSTLLDVPVAHLIAAFPEGRQPGSYCVEISEQQILGDPSYLMDSVAALKGAGIRIAIDDVGFGSSCLESLILLEPDVVKIDKRCVLGIARGAAHTRSLRRLLKVAESLGADVVAEGVNDREDLAVLKDLGVPLAQGFLWGMPE